MTYETLYQQGYKEARWGLRPTFLYAPPVDYIHGYQLGRRRRLMQRAIEITVIGIITIALSVSVAVLAANALAEGLPV